MLNYILLYNAGMKAWDVIIIGGGIIGLSLSIEIRKKGASVLVIERGEPGHEASRAAGGMLVDCSLETPPSLQSLARASARMYPGFAHELQVESGMSVDLRDHGTILISPTTDAAPEFSTSLFSEHLADREPSLVVGDRQAFYLQERSVDPRALTAAAWKTAKNRGVDFSSGDEVTAVNVSDRRVTGVTTNKTSFSAPTVVNCAGAWAGQIGPEAIPTRPVKGQMLCLAMHSPAVLKHVIRTPKVYLIPRSDGRLLVGATVEDAGYDKRTDVATIKRLYQAAQTLVPKLAESRILEDWAGLRPGTPDGLPILGATSTQGYYVATGHFRDGILLAPITAKIMAEVIYGKSPGYDLTAFSLSRFSQQPIPN
jgi:glycine oxidase